MYILVLGTAAAEVLRKYQHSSQCTQREAWVTVSLVNIYSHDPGTPPGFVVGVQSRTERGEFQESENLTGGYVDPLLLIPFVTEGLF